MAERLRERKDMTDKEHQRNLDFNSLITNSKHATNFDKIQKGDLVYVVHYAGDKWIPVLGIYEYTKSDGNLGITYISLFDRNAEQPRTISCQPNREVFLTEKECRDYINAYWYHHKCDNCKYDKYSAELTCTKCKNKTQFQTDKEYSVSNEPKYYCQKIFDKTGLQIIVSSGLSKTNGHLICRQYNPKINNGDWINYHWYMEVMKNCWCNADTESNCSAKHTVCHGASFKRELHKPNNISIRLSYQEREYIVRSYVPYYQWLKQTFIQGDKIFVDVISIEVSRNTKTVKYKDVEVKEFLNISEIENVVKENL